MTTKRQELTAELAYVLGRDRAEHMVSEMLAEHAESLAEGSEAFEDFREYMKGTDLGHAPRTWFLVARMMQERDHLLAEKIRSQAEEKERVLGRTLEVSAIERAVADRIDPKKAT